MSRHFGLLQALCFSVLCFCQLVTMKEGEEEISVGIDFDIDIGKLIEENEDLAKLFLLSAKLLTHSEAEIIKKESYHLTNVINMSGKHFTTGYSGKESNFPFFTTTPSPPMTAEERKHFKFVFPKGHFMNELLYGPQMTGNK